MEQKLLKFVLGLISKQLGITKDEAAELIYKKTEGEDGKPVIDKTDIADDALTVVLGKDAERVVKLKKDVDTTDIYNKAHDAAKVKVLSKAEKTLAAKYGVDAEGLKLDELVEKIVTEKVTEAGTKADNADAIKKSPTYLALEKSKNTEIEKLKSEHTEALKAKDKEHANGQIANKAKSSILSLLDELKPILPKNQKAADKSKNNFLREFDAFDFEASGKDFILINKETGKREEDAQGNPVFLSSRVPEVAAESFDFSKQTPKGNGGNVEDKNDDDSKITYAAKGIKTEDDYNQAFLNATDDEERAGIEAEWDAVKDS